MNKRQIERLMATEKQDTAPWTSRMWCYRRTPATYHRDAVWQYANRPTDGNWETIPTPPLEVLLRLTPVGSMTDQRLRWQGFHAEWERDTGPCERIGRRPRQIFRDDTVTERFVGCG